MNVSPSERVCVCVRCWISFWILQIRIHGECLLTAYFWTRLEMKKNQQQKPYHTHFLHVLNCTYSWFFGGKKNCRKKKHFLESLGKRWAASKCHAFIDVSLRVQLKKWDCGLELHPHHTYIWFFPFPNSGGLRWNLLAFSFELSFFWCV